MNARRRDAERDLNGLTTRRIARLAVLLAVFFSAPAHAGVAPGTPRFSFGVLAGTAQPVASMADYQWDVRPHAAWGAQAMAGVGPIAAGLRWWSSSTTQALGLTGQEDPSVRSQSLELVARARVAAWHRLSLHATAAGGRLALRWDPYRVTVDAGGTPVDVELSPIHTWVGGAGLALETSLPGGFAAGLEGERRAFALDTAHRSGSEVVQERTTFGEWAARVTIARTWNW